MISIQQLQQAWKAFVAKRGRAAAKEILAEKFKVASISELARADYQAAFLALEGDKATRATRGTSRQGASTAEDRRQAAWAERSKMAFRKFHRVPQ